MDAQAGVAAEHGNGKSDFDDPFAAMAAMLDGTDRSSEASWEVASQGSTGSGSERPKLVESETKGVGELTESTRLESAPKLRSKGSRPPGKPSRSPLAGSRPYTFPALGTRFCCVKRATVRASVEMDSEKAGVVEVGEELVALECKLNDRGQLRVRFERGWTSTTTLGGSVLLEPVPDDDDEDDDDDGDEDDEGVASGLNSGFVAAVEPAADDTSSEATPGKVGLPRAANSLGQDSSPQDTQDTSPHRVVYTIEEEEDQVPIQPMLYMAAKKAVVRAASRLDSPRIGLMSRGELILVTHTKMVGDTLRLRFGRGWTSAIGGDGRTIFIAENNPNRHYRAVKLGRVSVGFDESSETIGTITKNSVIEGVETREILPRGDKPRYRIRLKSGGWATEVAKSGVRLLTLVTFQRPDDPARPSAPAVGGLAGGVGGSFHDSPRKMIKRSGISSGVTITFGKGPLGMGLAENLEWMSASAVGAFATVVERFNLLADGSKGPVEASGRVHIGDLLVAVSGTDVRSEDHTAVISKIRACPRPFTITFCEPRLLAGLVLEGAPPRARRLSGGMLREQSLPRARSLSLQSTSDGTVPGDYSMLAQQAGGRMGGGPSNHGQQQPSHRTRRRHRSDPRNSRVSAADRVLIDTGEDDPDDDRVVERRSSGASYGSAALMPIEDIDIYELEEPLSGRSDRTYQSSTTSNMFDPATMGEDGLATRPGDWAGRAPEQIAGRIDAYDSASDVGDGGAFGSVGEKGWDDETATGSDGGTSSIGGSLRSFGGGGGGGGTPSEQSDLDRGLLDSEDGQEGVTTTPNPLAGLQGGLLGSMSSPKKGGGGAGGIGLGIGSGGVGRRGGGGGHTDRDDGVGVGLMGGRGRGGGGGGGGGGDFRERDIMSGWDAEVIPPHAGAMNASMHHAQLAAMHGNPAAGVMMIDAAEVLHKTGMLSKRGGIRKTWKPRYFVLSKTTLRYYEKPGDALPLGALSLGHAIIEEVPFHEMGKLYCFCARYDRSQRNIDLYIWPSTTPQARKRTTTKQRTQISQTNQTNQTNEAQTARIVPLIAHSLARSLDHSLCAFLNLACRAVAVLDVATAAQHNIGRPTSLSSTCTPTPSSRWRNGSIFSQPPPPSLGEATIVLRMSSWLRSLSDPPL
eukprot:COSAG06_NODE_3721_length_4976_cov_3.131232_3_plen_1138_part_00